MLVDAAEAPPEGSGVGDALTVTRLVLRLARSPGQSLVLVTSGRAPSSSGEVLKFLRRYASWGCSSGIRVWLWLWLWLWRGAGGACRARAAGVGKSTGFPRHAADQANGTLVHGSTKRFTPDP
ncbi:hypothetical protein GCM10010211_33420 [Streptomyces albospinus]|uniref:Uncharacterized protein n=1 Tax=Streptomyces albospinus TaxID=285515 RepID=A0ABQ2V262_9ACTN|nr:hypothetical protein GCM10010211_33420 [Streptomyces albospinus]